tara:strand:- start:501 stop:710 length:210 start_codon:yes stop_codon:yes gene_type:complete
MEEWEILDCSHLKKEMKMLIVQNNQLTENVIKLNEQVLSLRKTLREDIKNIKDILEKICEQITNNQVSS